AATPFFNDDAEIFIDGDRVSNDFVPPTRTGSKEGFQILSDTLGNKVTSAGGAFTNANWSVATSLVTGGYTMGFQVPLSLIDTQDGAGFTPAGPGSLLRFNAANTDNDHVISGQEKYAVLWKDGFTGPYFDGEPSWLVDLFLDNGTNPSSSAPLLLRA